MVTKLTNTDTNSTDLLTKAYVDAVSGGGCPTTNAINTYHGRIYTFINAINYCNNLSEGGNTDWKMPTFEELALHINTSEPRDLIWTSTIFSGTTAGYLSGLRLSNGDNGSIHNFTDIRVRSVR